MAKKAKKRGVKPGTKRGPYKKPKTKRQIIARLAKLAAMDKNMGWKVSENQVGPAKSPSTTCGQLEDAILLLETRISNATAKINSLM